MNTRRKVLSLIGLMPVFSPLSAFAATATYPNKPSRIVVGFAAGGGTDVLARLFAQRLEANYKQPYVVENKTGASGSIAAADVARSAPDGYNFLMAADAHIIYPHLSSNVPYNAVDDFTPIACLTSGPQCIAVHPDFPVNNLEELIELSKQRKGSLFYASGGAGTLTQMVVELIKSNSELDLTHVPFSGSGPSLIPVMAGEIPVVSSPLGILLPHIAAKKLKPIAVTSANRIKFLPDTASVSETKGFEQYEATSWVGLLGPKNMPAEVVNEINRFANSLSIDPEFIERLDRNAWIPVNLTAEEFKSKIQKDSVKWKNLIEKQGIKLDA